MVREGPRMGKTLHPGKCSDFELLSGGRNSRFGSDDFFHWMDSFGEPAVHFQRCKFYYKV